MSAFNKMFAVLTSFQARTERRDEDGITAIEYALMAAGIAVIIALAMVTLGDGIQGLFDGIFT